MIILPISRYLTFRFVFKGWENVIFELGRERVKVTNVQSPLSKRTPLLVAADSNTLVPDKFHLSLSNDFYDRSVILQYSRRTAHLP